MERFFPVTTANLFWSWTSLLYLGPFFCISHQVFLIDGSAERAFKTLSASFAPGSLDTYSIVCVTNASASDVGTVLTPAYFAFESALVARVLQSQAAFVGAQSVTAFSYFGGAAVALSDALQFVNASASVHNSSRALAYRALALGLANEYVQILAVSRSLFFFCFLACRAYSSIQTYALCSLAVAKWPRAFKSPRPCRPTRTRWPHSSFRCARCWPPRPLPRAALR